MLEVITPWDISLRMRRLMSRLLQKLKNAITHTNAAHLTLYDNSSCLPYTSTHACHPEYTQALMHSTAMRHTFVVALLASVASTSSDRSMVKDLDCQQKYRSCLLSGELADRCSCNFSTCSGNASALSQDWCVSLYASSTPTVTTEYACEPTRYYPHGAKCINTNDALYLVKPTLSGDDIPCNTAFGYPDKHYCASGTDAAKIISSTIDSISPTLSTSLSAQCTTNNDPVEMSAGTSRARSAGILAVPRIIILSSTVLVIFAC